MSVTLRVKNVEGLAEAFLFDSSVRPNIRFALEVTGEVAQYAMIWEWGRITCQPGPKTMWGTNPDGETVVMTKTAPNGFIRINGPQFHKIVREEMKKIPWKKIKKFRQIPPEIENALEKAAFRCANLIAETAPYDTFALRNAIRQYQIVDGEQVDKLSFRVRVSA